jgi:hypothetical protein
MSTLKPVSEEEFEAFISNYEYKTQLFCEGYKGKSAGGVAYLANDTQIGTVNFIDNKKTFFIIE